MARNKKYNSISRNGLIGEWLLNGNTLDTNDGTKNNGTATNVTYVNTEKGYQKQAGSFNGSSSYITLKNFAINNNSSFAIDILIRPNNVTSGYILNQQINTTGHFNLQLIFNNGKLEAAVSSQNVGGNVITSSSTFSIGQYLRIEYIYTSSTLYLYVNGKIEGSVAYSYGTANSTASFLLGKLYNNTNYYNGTIQGVRLYNRVLSQQEIQTLYQEGLRQLGAGSDNILSSAVAQFENFGDNNLENITSGIVATRTGGTSTTDNFSINKAIANPNYTWSSITYTAGYTFENSGSGWGIVTNPSGLSATGINRTTTLRSVFLMNKTLSADEVTELSNLCKIKYLYPFKKQLPLNLKEGLVFWGSGDTSGTSYLDASGNGNNGTMINSPVISRIGQHKQITLNGSNQYVNNIGLNNISLGANNRTMAVTISGPFTSDRVIYAIGNSSYNNCVGLSIHNTGELKAFIYGVADILSGFVPYGKHRLLLTINGTTYKLYIDGKLFKTATISGLNISGTQHILGNVSGFNNYTSGNIIDPMHWNRALSDIEIQEDFYSNYIN